MAENFLIPQKKAILATEKGSRCWSIRNARLARMGKMKKNLEKSPEESTPFLHVHEGGGRKRGNLRLRDVDEI